MNGGCSRRREMLSQRKAKSVQFSIKLITAIFAVLFALCIPAYAQDTLSATHSAPSVPMIVRHLPPLKLV